jgi:transcription elongation factor Elf1
LEEINLPDSIEHIDIGNNVLKGEFDFIRNTLLKYIRVSYNQLSSLENLSENLEELYCDHNILSSLNLKNTTRLSVLHCNYNSKLVLHDLPDTLIDTNLPEQRIQVENTKIKTTKEYLDSLRKYFNLKNEYETELMDLKRKAKSKKRILKTLPSCIGCSRKVGMVFSGKDQKYMAYCGDSAKPCDWKIVIHRGDFYSFLETIEKLKKDLKGQSMRMEISHVHIFLSYNLPW